MKNVLLLEEKNLKQAFAPVDLNTAAVVGSRVSMAGADKIAIVISLGASTGAAVEIALKQHDAASSGNTKALAVSNPYFHKAGSATKFTKVEQTVDEDTYDLASLFAADGGVVVFEVLAEDLDVNNGYSHISVNVADSGAAKVGGGMYVLSNLRNEPGYSTDI